MQVYVLREEETAGLDLVTEQIRMSIDKSLKTSGALSRHRNVLKRAERIEILKDEDRWPEDQSPFGMIKVAHRKAKVGGKVKEKAEVAVEGEGEKPAEGDVAPEADKK